MVMIDFSQPITMLDGTPMQAENGIVQTYATIVANTLMAANTGNPIKCYDMALKIYNNGSVEMDETDLNMVREFVANNVQLTNFAKAPILKLIDAALKAPENG